MKRLGLLFSGLALLSACAANPPVLDTDNANMDLTPLEAGKDIAAAGQSPLVWGGVVVSATNLEKQTQLEILSYPLNRYLRPDTNRTPTGRFLIRHEGYLETIDYAPGRKVTAVGSVKNLQNQKVGEASYDFPVMQDQQLHLWTEQDEIAQPRFNFGFGVVLTN
ncbi:MAG: Slp family lipoprotein [Gammaproteobacteria bacterium]|nr:Slp family lipoprotein [Gammaproteobacteria bacterium]